MAEHNKLGAEGERIAYRYIEQLGYTILEKNWSIDGKKEVDIFATDGRDLIAIEVKTRRTDSGFDPLTAVTRQKQANIIALTNTYVRLKGVTQPIRFDIIAVWFHPFDQLFDIKHYKDAFRATLRTRS